MSKFQLGSSLPPETRRTKLFQLLFSAFAECLPKPVPIYQEVDFDILAQELQASELDNVQRIEQYLLETPGNWHGAAEKCAQLWMAEKATPEMRDLLEQSDGCILPIPVQPSQQLPLLVRHSYERGGPNHKDFYYQLWHMDNPQKQGGRMMPVLCLNGPYCGEAFARLDEAVRCNSAWAWCTSDARSRPTSLLLSVTRKSLFCLSHKGRWLSLKHFNNLQTLPSHLFQLRDDGFTYRADLQPYSAFLPEGAERSPHQQVSVQWSREHWACEAQQGPCCCPAPHCQHAPMASLTTKHELRVMLRNPMDPYSLLLPHPRRLRGEDYWVRHESDDPRNNWYDAVAYTIERIY